MTLGKESGIAKPIEVEVKSGRGGIGHDAQEKRLREEDLERELAKKPKIDPDQYREQIAARKREGQLQRWIIAAARIIEKLDRDQVSLATGMRILSWLPGP
jgi:adenylosuccinate lyase